MRPPLTTSEEMQMVKEALLIPVMLDYLDNDIKMAKTAGFKLDLVLVMSLKRVQGQIIKEHHLLKQALKERGIKILTEHSSKQGIEATYLCRGYQHDINLLWNSLRTDILRKASQYAKVSLTDGDAS